MWKLCDYLRANSSLKSGEYCMPVLGIIFLKYMYLRFKDAETKINRSRSVRDGFELPIDEHDFVKMWAIKFSEQAQFKWEKHGYVFSLIHKFSNADFDPIELEK